MADTDFAASFCIPLENGAGTINLVPLQLPRTATGAGFFIGLASVHPWAAGATPEKIGHVDPPVWIAVAEGQAIRPMEQV